MKWFLSYLLLLLLMNKAQHYSSQILPYNCSRIEMELNFHKINSLQNFGHLVNEQSTYTNDLGKGGMWRIYEN
jgi:hypothetical protein